MYGRTSLPADVLWGSFVMRDKRTPKDVCGEATVERATKTCNLFYMAAKQAERRWSPTFKPVL